MAKDKQQQGGTGPKQGLVTESTYLNQPEGAMTFALNVVEEDGWKANEQGNLACYELPEGFTPIGQIFIDKNDTLLFLTNSDDTLSEIGLAKNNCIYETLVRWDLGFKINNQISGSYRLRRGCERTVYFSTPTPMIFNIDKPEDFKTKCGVDGDGNDILCWDANKFKLFKTYEKIPEFLNVEVTETGAIPAGSYNASIQYLDDDLNPTEWITTCEPIKIYNSSTARDYHTIRGSTNVIDGATNFGLTNKAINFTFGGFDESYPFYRVAIIEANSGTGFVTGVKFSAPISTNITTYIYTGTSSSVTEGTEEEIIAFNNIITEAEFIEQIENRLTLSKVKGVQINYCNLQKYASKIRAELALKTIKLNTLEQDNPKAQTINYYGTGYMPGEIYSFGIVWIIEGIGLSPTFHIPGRAAGFDSLMSLDNTLQVTYQDESCEDFWGLDSEGGSLKDKPVRHHRFPTRSSINEPLYNEVSSDLPFITNYLSATVRGTPSVVGAIYYRITYKKGGITYVLNRNILTDNYDPVNGIDITITDSTDSITDIVIEEAVNSQVYVVVTSGVASAATDLIYTTILEARTISNDVSLYETKTFGIQLSGITPPTLEDTNGNKVLGYYIVRNERTEDEKTILDSGVIAPMMEDNRGFVAHAHIFPNLADSSKLDKDILALIHPEHKFNNKEYKSATHIIQEGEYTIKGQSRTETITQDVGAGTSYDPEAHKRSDRDNDGFSLHLLARDTRVQFGIKNKEILTPFKRGEIAYLDTLYSRVFVDTDGERQEVYNVSGDNKVGIIKLDADMDDVSDIKDKLPYVIIKRTIDNPYGNFRVLPYYKENLNPIYFTDDVSPELNGNTTTIFNGDSYVTPMRYHSAVFTAFKIKERSTKSGIFKIILGALVVIAAVSSCYSNWWC